MKWVDVGDVVGVEEGYRGGIWLRSEAVNGGVGESVREVDHVYPGELMLVVRVDGTSVMVLSSRGVVGWTWESRLRVFLDFVPAREVYSYSP